MSAFYEIVQRGPWLDHEPESRMRYSEVLGAESLADSTALAATVRERYRSARAARALVTPTVLESGARLPDDPHLVSIGVEERIIGPPESIWELPEFEHAWRLDRPSDFDDRYALATNHISPYYKGGPVWTCLATSVDPRQLGLFGFYRVFAIGAETGLAGVDSHLVSPPDGPPRETARLETPARRLPFGLHLGEVYIASDPDDEVERLVRPVTATTFTPTPGRRPPVQRPPSNGASGKRH